MAVKRARCMDQLQTDQAAKVIAHMAKRDAVDSTLTKQTQASTTKPTSMVKATCSASTHV